MQKSKPNTTPQKLQSFKAPRQLRKHHLRHSAKLTSKSFHPTKPVLLQHTSKVTFEKIEFGAGETHPLLDPKNVCLVQLLGHMRATEPLSILPLTFTPPLDKYHTAKTNTLSTKINKLPRFNPNRKSPKELISSLRNWITDNDGFIHECIHIIQADPSDDGYGGWTLQTTSAIPAGAVIGTIPLDLSLLPLSKSPPPENKLEKKINQPIPQSTLEFYNTITNLFIDTSHSNKVNINEMGEETISEDAILYSSIRLMAELMNYETSFYKPYLDTINLNTPQVPSSWPSLTSRTFNPPSKYTKLFLSSAEPLKKHLEIETQRSSTSHPSTSFIHTLADEIHKVSSIQKYFPHQDPNHPIWKQFVTHACNNNPKANFHFLQQTYNYVEAHCRPLSSRFEPELLGITKSLRTHFHISPQSVEFDPTIQFKLPTNFAHEPFFGQLSTPSLQPNITFRTQSIIDDEHFIDPITNTAVNKSNSKHFLYPNQYHTNIWYATRDILPGEHLSYASPQFTEFPFNQVHSPNNRKTLNLTQKSLLGAYPSLLTSTPPTKSKEHQIALYHSIDSAITVEKVLHLSKSRFPWIHPEAGAASNQITANLNRIFGPIDEFMTFSSSTPMHVVLPHDINETLFSHINVLLSPANMMHISSATEMYGKKVVNKQQLLQYLLLLQTTSNFLDRNQFYQQHLDPLFTLIGPESVSKVIEFDTDTLLGLDMVSANLLNFFYRISSFTTPSNEILNEFTKINIKDGMMDQSGIDLFNSIVQYDLSKLIKLTPRELFAEVKMRQEQNPLLATPPYIGEDSPPLVSTPRTPIQEYGIMLLLLERMHHKLVGKFGASLTPDQFLQDLLSTDPSFGHHFSTSLDRDVATHAAFVMNNQNLLLSQHVYNSLATKLGLPNRDFFTTSKS